ncbi:glycosyltransferase family 4 protein [Roseospira navarrensis]|uniref:Glycosyltransferase n=1 Tax=Roseospira navarrensis TaxID=140058 RepID=A0A7X2D2P9_9PROT|nr:glycosyltransferase family 4 protein [Roseospira navarrensis]MQX35931.1 glycosyltransferase [Roseospira navarrensis]
MPTDGDHPGGRRGVLIASQWYWPEVAGSAPPVQQMAEILAADPAVGSVTVHCARPFYPHREVLADWRDGRRDDETHTGVTIRRLPMPPPKGAGIRARLGPELLFAARLWARLRRRSTHRDAMTVVAVCPSILTVVAVAAALPRRIRRVAVVHDVQSGLAASLKLASSGAVLWLLRRVERAALNRMDEIITLSPAMTETLRDLGVRTPVRIVPPTIDDDRIRPRPEPAGPVTLLYSGNVGRKQGLDQLLGMAEAIRDRALPAQVVIRGDGNYKATLMDHATARGLDAVVRFEPFCPPEALAEGMAAGHVHLVPQDPAGAAFAVPSKIYAIMAAGRPFVCTAVAGSPMDGIRKAADAFVICPPEDGAALADAVQALIDAPAERARLGRNGRAYVEATAGKAACRAAYRAAVLGHTAQRCG